MIDNDKVGYYLLFNIPVIIYTLLFIFTFFRYQRDYFAAAPPKPATDQEQNLIATSKLPASLYNKLYQNMRIQRYYFALWFISILPNFFMLTSTGLVWYSVFIIIHPLVIIVIALWAIQINAQSLERQTGVPGANAGDGKPGQEGKGTELSDYSSFIDDRSADNSMMGEAGAGDTQYRQVDSKGGQSFEDHDLGQKLFTAEQLSSFKEIVQNHILANIILGIQGGIQEKPAPRHLYDKELGFGAPSENFLGEDPTKKPNKKAPESQINYMGRHTKSFFSFMTQAVASQISIKDPNAEALVLEGLVLGHPDILRKFNVAIKQDELDKQCKIEKVYKGANPEQGSTFDFIELAPEVFYMIRRIQNVPESLVKRAFSPENLENITVSVSQTKGGSFYVKPEQGGIII